MSVKRILLSSLLQNRDLSWTLFAYPKHSSTSSFSAIFGKKVFLSCRGSESSRVSSSIFSYKAPSRFYSTTTDRNKETTHQICNLLPIGIQSFEKVRNNGLVYVDKTAFAGELILSGGSYFLSRPRRFGKSLFLSLLNTLLTTKNKEDFKGYQIYDNPGYPWKNHAVLYLDFSLISCDSPEELKADLIYHLNRLGEQYGIDMTLLEKTTALGTRLDYLIRRIHKQHNLKIAVLVDEYDKPLTGGEVDHLVISGTHRSSLPKERAPLDANIKILKGFYDALEGLNPYINFMFVTGVTNLVLVPLFSGFNNLTDISLDPRYASLPGYTVEEIRENFAPHIAALVQESLHNKNSLIYQSFPSEDFVIKKLSQWYKGYKFSQLNTVVYNPHSILNFFDRKALQNYWFATAPTYLLVKVIQNLPNFPLGIGEEITVSEDALAAKSTIEYIDPVQLLLQSGYLSIVSYNKDKRTYQLAIPNREVRISLSELLKG